MPRASVDAGEDSGGRAPGVRPADQPGLLRVVVQPDVPELLQVALRPQPQLEPRPEVVHHDGDDHIVDDEGDEEVEAVEEHPRPDGVPAVVHHGVCGAERRRQRHVRHDPVPVVQRDALHQHPEGHGEAPEVAVGVVHRLKRNESEAAPEAVKQAVEGGCQSGWGRLLSVTNAIQAGSWCQGHSGWA